MLYWISRPFSDYLLAMEAFWPLTLPMGISDYPGTVHHSPLLNLQQTAVGYSLIECLSVFFGSKWRTKSVNNHTHKNQQNSSLEYGFQFQHLIICILWQLLCHFKWRCTRILPLKDTPSYNVEPHILSQNKIKPSSADMTT